MKVYQSNCIVYHPSMIKKEIAEINDINKLNNLIHEFQQGYIRVMPAINEADAEKLNGIMIDFGSYSDFLYVDGITFEEYVKEDRKNG